MTRAFWVLIAIVCLIVLVAAFSVPAFSQYNPPRDRNDYIWFNTFVNNNRTSGGRSYRSYVNRDNELVVCPYRARFCENWYMIELKRQMDRDLNNLREGE